jgi:hypothetical protein
MNVQQIQGRHFPRKNKPCGALPNLSSAAQSPSPRAHARRLCLPLYNTQLGLLKCIPGVFNNLRLSRLGCTLITPKI